MPTPNLYLHNAEGVFDQVSPDFQTNFVDVIYVTDRRSEHAKEKIHYGHKRSESLDYGLSRVQIGKSIDWDELVEYSTTNKSWKRPKLTVTEVEKTGQFAATVIPRINVPDISIPVFDPVAIEELKRSEEEFQTFIRKQLKKTTKKEAFIFIHGFNNDFTDASFIMANLWHFLGREGIPIVYTWPAGHGGLTGYFVDRESGEFTVLHLKVLLNTLAETEGLKKIHVLAHSRGTDVFLTALRELHLLLASNLDLGGRPMELYTREKLKLGNVVLAAPDLDLEVVSQRAGIYGLAYIPEQFTIYLNEHDKALGIARWLFASVMRLGNIAYEDLSDEDKEWSNLESDFSFVEAKMKSGFISHGYFHSNPQVSSDLILILRDGKKPGEKNGRPLKPTESKVFWKIEKGYPKFDQ